MSGRKKTRKGKADTERRDAPSTTKISKCIKIQKVHIFDDSRPLQDLGSTITH